MEIIDNDGNAQSENKKTRDNTGTRDNYNQGDYMPMKNDNSGKAIGGLIIVAIGLLFLGREMGLYIPRWLFSWPMILIAIGVYSGVKNNFQNIGWLVCIVIGFILLIRNWLPDFIDFSYLWPMGLIIVGLYMIVKPKSSYKAKKKDWDKYDVNPSSQTNWQQSQSAGYRQGADYRQRQSTDSSEYIETSAVFGSVRKSVMSKDFKGGEINSVFGSAEVNLAQADITQIVELEVNAVFGGVRLIVPLNWEIKSELTAVLGSVEDKRTVLRNANTNSDTFLVLKGTAVFGGIEIIGYN